MKIPDMTTRHDVMDCPVCGLTIRAEVHLSVKAGDAKVQSDGTVSLPIEPRMERFHISHACPGRIEAEDAPTTEAQQ